MQTIMYSPHTTSRPLCTLAAVLLSALPAMVMAQDFDVIRTQPEGTLRTYLRSGGAFYAYYGSPTLGTQQGTVIDIVTAPDGKTVYMKNPISQANAGTWVQGTLGDDGRLHVPLNQCVQYFDQGYGWKTVVLRLDAYDDWNGAQYYIADLNEEVTFSFSADGTTITMDSLEGPEDQGGYPGAMYALVYTDDNSFVGYADFNSVYTPFNLTYTTLPDGLTHEQWTFTYSNAQEGESETVPVARDDQHIYIAGMSIHDPQAAIVGNIDGDRVSFTSDQYVGHSSGFLLYAFGASYETKTFYDDVWNETYTTNVMTPTPTIDFRFDASTGRLTAIGDMALVLNMGKVADQGINYMSVALDPIFQAPASVDGLSYSTLAASQPHTKFYDLNGRQTNAPRSGITIISTPNGTTRKVLSNSALHR